MTAVSSLMDARLKRESSLIPLKMEGVCCRPAPDAALCLRGVDLELRRGEWVALLGRSGAGKTTLLQTAAGLLPRAGGTITVAGEQVPLEGALADAAIRRLVGFCFQSPEEQFFAATALDEVAFAPSNMGLSRRAALRAAAEALEMVGLDPGRIGGRSPFGLSGGEQRRVALASVLAARPVLLLADEPTAGLDPAAQEAVVGALRRIAESGTAILMATHDVGLALACATRCGALVHGRLEMVGGWSDPEGVASVLQRAGLTPTPLLAVWAELARLGCRLSLRRLTPEGLARAAMERIQGGRGGPA